MFQKLVAYILIVALSLPQTLAAVSTAESNPQDMERKIEEANNLKEKLSRLISADGIEFELKDIPQEPETPPESDPPQEPENPPTEDPQDPGTTPPAQPPQDPPDEVVNPGPPANAQLGIVYACLLENLQQSVSKLYEYARPSIVEYNGSQLSSQKRPALKFSVVVEGDGVNKVRFRPFGRCYQNAGTLPANDYRTLIFDLRDVVENTEVAPILSELSEIQELRKEGGATDQYIQKNSARVIHYLPKKAPVSRASGVKHVLKELAGRSSLDAVGTGLTGIVDPDFSKLGKYSLKKAGYWILSLRILLDASFDTREEMEVDAVRDQTAREVVGVEDARDRAEDAQKSADRKELWGNIAKVGLAIGGGILAWKLIDSLNDDDDDDDEDDRFDGPYMPPMPPPWMMQPPYGAPPMYPPGGGYPPPYPPAPSYPPMSQPGPPFPPAPPQQGADYGRILVDLKAKLEAIIRKQRELITRYVQRTNVNMTNSDKDTFRRTVAQLDGLVRESNPLIQLMENTAVPGNPQDMGTIFDARRKVYQYITEVKDNDRQIKEFMGQMNLMGSGLAGPLGPGTSPLAPGSSPGFGATPWNSPQVQRAVDGYLASNSLNQWGYPDTPGVIQNTPPSAMGKNRYQWLMENPSIRGHVQRNMR
jgi:hypothetical protein